MQREPVDPADPVPRDALDRVSRALADLGTDAASAPPVPADVTAAVHAALRNAAQDASHDSRRTPAHRPDRPALRWRGPAAVTGALAAALALGFGVFALVDDDSAAGGFSRDPGPSARHITVESSALPLTDAQILLLLQRPPDLGPLDDLQRCLVAAGYPAGTRLLGAQPVPDGVLLVLPAPTPAHVVAVVLAADCPADGGGALARTELARP